MKKPTKAQIKKEIAALRKMKPRVLHYSGFDDDHHAAIDAQIYVLENDLSRDDIYEREIECRELECPGEDDISWHVENVSGAGFEAADWLAGESEYKTLTENWKPLMDREPATVLRPMPVRLPPREHRLNETLFSHTPVGKKKVKSK